MHSPFTNKLWAVLAAILLNLTCVPAPVPRCSFFIVINKLSEYSNILSDANPYFPVPPCEYGGPWQAIRAGDYRSVFILAEPQKIPRHNFYELIWFMRKGAARIGRIWRGEEPFIHDDNILREGYSHYTPYPRTRTIGTGETRRPEIIDNPKLYSKVISAQIREINKNNDRPHRRPPPHHGGGYRQRPKRKIHSGVELQEEQPYEPQVDPAAQPAGYRLPVELSNYEVAQHHPQQPEQQQYRTYRDAQAETSRELHGGFLPGFSPSNQAESDPVDDDDYYSHTLSERSDTAVPKPEAVHPEFRPHQKVYRTKPLEDFQAAVDSNFGERIEQRKTN